MRNPRNERSLLSVFAFPIVSVRETVDCGWNAVSFSSKGFPKNVPFEFFFFLFFFASSFRIGFFLRNRPTDHTTFRRSSDSELEIFLRKDSCSFLFRSVDPELAETMPAKLTAHTGMDALTHAVEAYVSTCNCNYTDPLAIYAAELITGNLVKSFNGDMAARDTMHDAQCLAGMAFSNALLGIVHSMAHKTGAAFANGHIIHGAANAMYLPKVIKFNSKDATAKKRYGQLADYLHLGGKNDDEKVDKLIALVRKMNDDLKIPQSIKNYGNGGVIVDEKEHMVPEEEFLAKVHDIAVNALGDACTGSNPRQPSVEEMEKLLKCCYYDTEVDF